MGSLESVLRDEMGQIAQRELRSAIMPLHNQIRDLSRLVKRLGSELERVSRKTGTPVRVAREETPELVIPEAEANKIKMTPATVKQIRGKLGCTQGQLAVLLGVSPAAVQSWEQDIASPAGSNKIALAALEKMTEEAAIALLREKGISKPPRKPRTTMPSAKKAKAVRKTAKKRGRRSKK